MAASTIIKQDTDGTITLLDGTGSPITHAVPFTQGDLSIEGLGPALREVVRHETRGTLHSVRYGARTYPTISFSAMVADYSDGTDQTAVDFILKNGSYSSNVSTLGSGAEVYTFSVQLDIEGTDHGDAADHQIVALNVDGTLSVTEGQPNTISFSGTVNGAIGSDGTTLSDSVTMT